MFALIVLAASLVAYTAAPALADTQEFPPGFSAKQKIAWAKREYPAICRAPVPDDIKNIRVETLEPEVVDIINAMTKQTAVNFIKGKCGSQSSIAVVQN